MNIPEIISILENSLITIANARSQAVAIGDLAQVTTLDNKYLETQASLSKLKNT